MSTKSLLITFSGYPFVPSTFLPDNGLAQLAACLVEAGHETTILDFNTPTMMRTLALPDLWKELPLAKNREEISEISFETSKHFQNVASAIGREIAERVDELDWIGFKLWNGDGYLGSLRMAEEIKRAKPDLPIIAGGPHVDWFEEYLLEKSPPFDFLSYAEGEPMVLPFVEFVEGRRGLGEVPNIIFRDKSGKPKRTRLERVKNLDQLPIPLYDAQHYPAFARGEKIKIGVFEETRGCPMKCYFCAHPVKSGDVMRKFPVQKAVDRLHELVTRYGFKGWKLAGSFTPCQYLRKFCEEMIARDFYVPFTTYGHMNNVEPDDFDLFKKAGCFALFFGVESGDQLILDTQIRKRYKAEGAASILKRCKASGIFTVTSLIFPNVGETEASKQATLNLVREVRPDSAPCHFPFLLPNTPWSKEPERFGFRVTSQEDYLSKMLTYKARLMFPPEFWEPLPYEVDGMSFDAYARKNAEMLNELESLGVVTLLSDENALISHLADIPARTFRDTMRSAFLTGDADTVTQILNQANK